MKISLITACFNSEATIRTAIDSVLSQKGVDIEYIIVDGGSTDGTVDIIKEYSTRSTCSTRFSFKWISERDRGMYDAINKGIKMATGDVVGILNADDVLASDETLKRIAECFSRVEGERWRRELDSRVEHVERVDGLTRLPRARRVPRDAGERFRRRAEEKVGEWLEGVSDERFVSVLDSLLNEKLATGEYRFKGDGGREAMRDGAIRFFKGFSRRIVQLSDGRCVYFAPDERARRRNSDKAVSWAEYAVHAVTNGGQRLPGKTYNERWLNYHKIEAFDVLESTLLLERCVVRSKEDARYDAIMFVGDDVLGRVVSVVTRLDDFGNIDANLTEVTFEASSKRVKKAPRLMPLAEAVETVVHRQVAAGSNPSTRISIADSTVSGKGMAKDISRGGARVDAVYADIRFVKEGETVEAVRKAETVRYCSAKRWRPWMFRFAAMVPHPSFYVRRECFERLGGYSLDYRICADFELELRYLLLAKLRAAYLPECVVVMRMGGMSTSGWRSNLVINREDLRALRAHGIWSCMPLIYLKYLFKIWGFVFRG